MRAQDMLLDAARRDPKRIVLCEGDDPRVKAAARRAAADGIAQVLLLGSSEDVPGVHGIRPADSGWLDAFAEELLSLRRARGMTPEQAREAVRQPLVFAALMVRLGHADGSVAGTVHTTADVVRTVVYLRDVNDAEDVAKAHLETFDKIRPASTLIQVSSMLRPWQKVEIEVYAQIA